SCARPLPTRRSSDLGTTVKERVPLDVTPLSVEGDALTTEAQAYVAERFAEAHIDDVDVRSLRPALTTAYERRTVWLPDSGARLRSEEHTSELQSRQN